MENTLVTIVGATAIGKTALSIALAKYFNCEIISCDSRQFYKEMTIGTAVPDPEELAAAPHHFIQTKSIFDTYSVGQFEKEALQKLDVLFLQNPIQIMVGGSGLYADAVLKGLDEFPEIDPKIRKSLNKELEENGIQILQETLQNLDAVAYENIAIENPHRLIRALEICIGTGKTFTSFKNKPKQKRNFKPIVIGLHAEREILYHRINLRVDKMIANGLIKEAKELYPNRNLNALKTVGYRELFEYFDGNISKETAIEEIKKNSRRFAKRQGTWFRRNSAIKWFDYHTECEKIINYIAKEL
ncbi:tRNA (adenosine(37)-N6)-dimethylallyltransferase MiaA [Tenacibaculum sp. SG-28]|uniref:tRNA (adenosine(37)-N6)-dimethylallyltransferase MiaA n=1 Tax=Tenacibaculum sp. SG-28 TaxID=754426 RepID=UPI000CF40B3C|nr:tRNA (adenosine(37)-N6)-dimethylallyltransferase MiaA [Tenacibaculum sp. SG-28]PQJ23462.1 tRNA (adenosine(37)-N6)-dimethylallyltransferase MiaA [Tenacibaculum sp. SG-28]